MQVLKDEVQRRIVAAAIDEFCEKGYRQASLRVIAHSAGTSVSNLYHYFPDKRGLFQHITGPLHTALMDLMRRFTAIKSPDKTTLESMNRSLTEFLAQLDANERRIVVLLVERSGGSEYEKTKQQLSGMLESHFAESLGKCTTGQADARGGNTIYGIISDNFINGVLRIVEKNSDEPTAAADFRTFLEYHSFGLSGLGKWMNS